LSARLTWCGCNNACLSSKGFRLLDRERRNGQSWGRWNVVKVGQGLFTSSFVESGLYDWFNALLMAPTAHTLGYLALAVSPPTHLHNHYQHMHTGARVCAVVRWKEDGI
jgi:hypothetical protein